MKKMIYLLLLLLTVYPGFAFEKTDLTCMIRKGDQWKMAFEILTNIDHDFNKLDSIVGGAFSLKSGTITALSEWQVECTESADTSFELKLILTRIRLNDIENFYEKHAVRYSNDTDYPLDLADEQKDEINNILGRSFTCRIYKHNESRTEIISDEFENKEIILPGRYFMSRDASFMANIEYRYNIYGIIGPDFVRIVLDSWNAIIPKENKNVGDVWAPSGLIADKNRDLNVVFEKQSGDFAYLKQSGKDDNDMIMIHKNIGLPFVIMSPEFKAYVYDFKDIANTSITGKFTEGDLNGTAVLKSETADYEINENVQVKDGFFEIPLNLKQPVICTLRFNSKTFYLFLTPGMQIHLNWNESNKKLAVEGFGANDVQCVLKFWNEYYYMDYETSKFPYELIIEKRDEYKKRVYDILKSYEGLISKECRNFIETESKFRIANSYSVARQDVESEKSLEKNLDVSRAAINASYFENFNDSLTLIGDVTNYSPAYNVFIDRNLELKNRIFLAQRGRRYERDNIRENLLFAALHYVGYPYYYSAFMLLKSEILKGNQDKITQEIDEFINLPVTQSFSNTLKQLIQEMEIIKEGNPFPFPEIVDMENNKVEIPKGHFTIVDISNSFYLRSPQHQEELEELSRIIKEDSQLEKINYVVIRPDFAKGKMTESVGTEYVNFLYIYLPENDQTLFEKIKLTNDNNRLLLLNKDRMIIDNNIGKIGQYSGHKLPEILDEYLNSTGTLPAKSEIPWLYIIGSFTGFALLSWLVIRIRTKKIAKSEAARRKVSELELKAIRSQMNPHFIFNAMGSIQNLINQNDVKNANLYLSSFARLMRMVLSNSNKKLVNLADELELLKNYLELEQLRVDFQYTISLSENIDPENEEIPGMLVQPFVENAVIHGITPKGHGIINVQFSKEDGVLTCIVEDDGVGFDVSENGNSQSLAMKLSEKRLNLLNSQVNEKLHLKVENRNEDRSNGTRVTLLIPV